MNFVKFNSTIQQAGKKEGNLSVIPTRNFCPLAHRAEGAQGWKTARLCSSREAKPAKIVSLIEKEFCARPLKDMSIFASFASPPTNWLSKSRLVL